MSSALSDKKKHLANRELSIVIPVYNEKEAIIDTIHSLTTIMEQHAITYELIVVNDGSTDGTGDLLEKLAEEKQEETHFRLISHSRNKGYGSSLKTGIQKTRYDAVCITDADSTYPNERIPELFDVYLSGYDMVVGERQFKHLPFATRPAKWILNKLANFLAGEKIKDINSGLRIFNKQIALKFFPIICDGFSFTTTITLAMITNNYLIKFIPIDYYKRRGRSKINPFHDTLNFFQLIIRTVMYFNPLKIFLPISFFMFFLSIFLFILGHTGVLKESPSDTISILFVGGIQVLVTGMIADLIDKRVEK